MNENSILPAKHPRKGRERVVHLGETSRERRAHAERLLARYPRLAPGELDELLEWYRREASAMDVALIASDDRIRGRYRAFREDHIDGFSVKEKLASVLLAVGALGFIGAVALLGLEA
jgi:hypothetical protein